MKLRIKTAYFRLHDVQKRTKFCSSLVACLKSIKFSKKNINHTTAIQTVDNSQFRLVFGNSTYICYNHNFLYGKSSSTKLNFSFSFHERYYNLLRQGICTHTKEDSQIVACCIITNRKHCHYHKTNKIQPASGYSFHLVQYISLK